MRKFGCSNFLLFLIPSLVIFQCFPAQANRGSEKPEPFRLSSLIQNKKLMGLTFDSSESQVASELEVQEFLHFKRGVGSLNTPSALQFHCSGSDHDKSPFCELVVNPKFGKLNVIDPAIRKEKRKKARVLVKSVLRGDLTAVVRLSQSSSETDLSQAFRFVRSSQKMKVFAEKVLKQDHCDSNPLLVALGLRMENEFPAAPFRSLAESLYKKAFACGKDQSSVAAGYRLGLFQLWSSRYDLAEEVLAKIPESAIASVPIDYRMRIDYWRAVCAQQLKNVGLQNSLKAKVFHRYPLSLHTLVLNADLKNWEAQLSKSLDPEVALRSNSEVNRITRAIEILLLRGERETAAILLKAEIPRILKTEIPFQTYWAVLLQRAGDLASSFQLIAAIFRQDPNLISKATLQLLYPMEQFDKIQRSDPQGDPYLILSLVRQESAFDVGARSSAGAQGLMQLQWPTARQFERVSTKQLWEPETNLRVGVKYLRKLVNRFEGRLDYALAAYNAGPERIKVWSKRYPTSEPLLFLDLLPLQETRDYVSAIARNYYWYRHLYPTERLGAGYKPGLSSLGEQPLGRGFDLTPVSGVEVPRLDAQLTRIGDPLDGQKLLLLFGVHSGG